MFLILTAGVVLIAIFVNKMYEDFKGEEVLWKIQAHPLKK